MIRVLALFGLLAYGAVCAAVAYGYAVLASRPRPEGVNLMELEPLDREWLEANAPFMERTRWHSP